MDGDAHSAHRHFTTCSASHSRTHHVAHDCVWEPHCGAAIGTGLLRVAWCIVICELPDDSECCVDIQVQAPKTCQSRLLVWREAKPLGLLHGYSCLFFHEWCIRISVENLRDFRVSAACFTHAPPIHSAFQAAQARDLHTLLARNLVRLA